MLKVAEQGSAHALEFGVAVESSVGERHPASRRRRQRVIVNDDAVAFSKQAMGHRGADVADAPDEYDHTGLPLPADQDQFGPGDH